MDQNYIKENNVIRRYLANELTESELAEFEIYGTGVAPQATYTSKIIDFGRPVSLGEFNRSGEEKDASALVRLHSACFTGDSLMNLSAKTI